jgi:hypothetical protein
VTAVEPELAPTLVDSVEHLVCCHEPTLALCGAVTDGQVDGDEADCIVCLDLHPNLDICPLGGRCHMAEKPTRKADR